MTGKRSRGALARTTSVSQLGSGNLSQQEFSPLPENPKEKLKPTVIEKLAPSPSPRVVIGFDPKPFDSSSVSPNSAPCSPSFNNDKASSPRSVLNTLFSRHSRVAKPSDGVGLGIALTPSDIVTTTMPVASSRGAIPVVQQHQRRHSHPIPTPGVSPCRLHDARRVSSPHRKACNQPRPAPPAWMDPLDRRDTFLLGETPARVSVLTGDGVAAALTASSHFLDECSFCKRHLPKDKDIFMYRGDKAFCSVECRSKQMVLDERSKICSLQGATSAPSLRTPASSMAAA